MSRVTCLLLVATSTLASVSAQQRTEERLAFEVTSVRPATDQNSGGFSTSPSGLVTFRTVDVESLLRRAFEISPDRIVGLPDWAKSEYFDIVARAPGYTPASQVPLLLRSLLEDRFGLVMHREARERDVYVLLTARDDRRLGVGLAQAVIDCASVMEEVEAARRDAVASGGDASEVFE